MRWFRLLVCALVVGGCSSEPEMPRPAARDRQAATESKLGMTPPARTYRYADGEMRVFDVPVKDGSGFVDQQRCFVWRDHEFKTSSISCGQMPEVLLSGPAN